MNDVDRIRVPLEYILDELFKEWRKRKDAWKRKKRERNTENGRR